MWPPGRRTSVVRLDGYPLVAPDSRLVLLDVGRGGIARMDILANGKEIGAVPGIDPETGHYFDDTKRYIDQLPLSAQDKAKKG